MRRDRQPGRRTRPARSSSPAASPAPNIPTPHGEDAPIYFPVQLAHVRLHSERFQPFSRHRFLITAPRSLRNLAEAPGIQRVQRLFIALTH